MQTYLMQAKSLDVKKYTVYLSKDVCMPTVY